MKTFPIMLNMHRRAVVVVGGGNVGARKAASLSEAGAVVTIVAPDVQEEGVADGTRILRQAYDDDVLEGASLVFACTDDARLNARIAADARSRGLLVNVADQPEDCDFFMPSVIRQGDVVVAVGTGGSAPGLSAELAKQLQAAVPPRIGEFAALLEDLRGRLRTLPLDSRRRMNIMKQLCTAQVHRLFLDEGPGAVADMFDELLAK